MARGLGIGDDVEVNSGARLAAGDPAVDALTESGKWLYGNAGTLPPAEFLRLLRAGVHSARETPDELPPWLEHGARLAAPERPPWEAEVPFEVLAAAPFPKLVISGGHSSARSVVCVAVREVAPGTRQPRPARPRQTVSHQKRWN